jgi:hypothetical protein
MLLSVYNSEKERLTPGCSSASGINYKRTSPSPSSHSKSSGMRFDLFLIYFFSVTNALELQFMFASRTPTPNCVLDEWRMEAAIVSILQLTDSEKQLICPPFRLLDPPEV